MPQRTAIIVGAGPAGLTAAFELVKRTDIKPIVLESDDIVGGIARTVEHKGNRIDLGGHRFFSKSERVMTWWQKILPLQRASSDQLGATVAYQGKYRWVDLPGDGPDPDFDDEVMLVRPRSSQILFRGQLFEYPLRLSFETLKKLGVQATARIFSSYIWAHMCPRSPERSLADFFINRFGNELYETFFKTYTEKVWGISCEVMPADWGAQRVKGLSLWGALWHAIARNIAFIKLDSRQDIETSLVEQFLYPKYGPGQMWQSVAHRIKAAGGEIRMRNRVVGFEHDGTNIKSVLVQEEGGVCLELRADFVFSSMPVCELISCFNPSAPREIERIAEGLIYRDFITVGLLLTKITINGGSTGQKLSDIMPSNWIYVQEPHVKVGRLQFFNNWSPFMVSDEDKIWIGLEYFCNEGDELWKLSDSALTELAADELEAIGIAEPSDVLTSIVVRMPKTYPAYTGTYDRFNQLRHFTDEFKNLFLIGRNGMHRYNNQDHSMLTAMVAVDNIVSGELGKDNIWSINTERDYHEER